MSQKDKNIEPVYFMDLVVENIRCFKGKQVMDLSDDNGKPARWTIILGDNGTGKTTLLKCLAFLKPEKFVSPNDKNKFRIVPEGFKVSNFHQSYSNQLKNKIYIGTTNLSQGEISKPFNRIIKQYSFESYNNNTAISSASFSQQKQLFIIAYGATRQMGNGSLTESKNKGSIESLFHPNIDLLNAEAWLLETDFAIKNSKGNIKVFLENHYLKVKDTLKKLLPDIIDFRIKKITRENRQAAIEIKTPYGWVDMKNLSHGYQSFIAWVVDLAARLFDQYPYSKNPLEEPCIVLVDEIDLHLHPKWQRKVIQFLTDIFKNAQFIVTAHSPLIVQAAEDANIVLLRREGDSVKIYNSMDKEVIRGWRVDQILTSDLFGLDSARPPKYDKALERKQNIIKKKRLTASDKKELENISKELEDLEIPNEAASNALEALKKATAILKS